MTNDPELVPPILVPLPYLPLNWRHLLHARRATRAPKVIVEQTAVVIRPRMSLTEFRSSSRRPDQVAARVDRRRAGGEGDRPECVHRHGHHRGVAETQPRQRRRALQGREPRGPARIAAGSQLAVVRERGRQRRIKVRGSS